MAHGFHNVRIAGNAAHIAESDLQHLAADLQHQFHYFVGFAGVVSHVDGDANTVGNVRQRFAEQGLEAALERKKQENPSRPCLLEGEKEARLILKTVISDKPPHRGNQR